MANKKTSKPSKKKPGPKPVAKKSTKAAGETLAAAAGPCVTNGGRWRSRINGMDDGFFRVFNDGPGFIGDHSSGPSITGQCRGNGMDIQMRAPGAGFFHYSGNFTDMADPTRIRNGRRTFVSFPSALGLDPAPPPPGEPWEADKET